MWTIYQHFGNTDPFDEWRGLYSMLLHPTPWPLKMRAVVVFNIQWATLYMFCEHATKTIQLNQKHEFWFLLQRQMARIVYAVHVFSTFLLLGPLGRHIVAFSLVLTGMLVRTWLCVCVTVSESIFVNMLCMKLFSLPCSLMDVNLSFLQGNREEGRSCVCMELLCWGQGTENGWSSATLFSV